MATRKKAAVRKRTPTTVRPKVPGVAVLARQVLAEVEKQKNAGRVANRSRRRRRNAGEDIGAPPKKIRDLVEEFLGHGLESVEFMEAPAWVPNDGVNGGNVVAIEYEAFKPHLDKKPEVYRHEFEPGSCKMVITGDKVIVLLGSYGVETGGITG